LEFEVAQRVRVGCGRFLANPRVNATTRSVNEWRGTNQPAVALGI
jgi:hypothetical protein